MHLQMMVFETGHRWRKAFVRMVLEPKFADYGSIHSIGEAVNLSSNSANAISNNRSTTSTSSAPLPITSSNCHHQKQQQQQQEPSESLSLDAIDVCQKSSSITVAAALQPQSQSQSQSQQSTTSTSKQHHPVITIMTQGDLYQTQPLLPLPSKGGNSNPESSDGYNLDDDDDDDDMSLHKAMADHNGAVKITIPIPVREEPRFPQERWKTLIAAIILFFSGLLVLISLATVHERVPDRSTYGPLPDIFFDVFGARDWGLMVSEWLIIIAFNSTILMIVLHKHRFILAKRLFLIMSLLYIYRAATMFVTVLPVSSTTYYCAPKSNHTTTLDMAKRVVQMLSGMGLSINGKQTYCGDFIYSGHTLTIVLSYLFISEYTPKKLYIFHWFYWLVAVTGVFMLQLSRSHYTIDVIIAYYVTTRIFWIYHTLANNIILKQHSEKNLLSRMWWFSLFLYFEGNVGGQVPRKWPDWPFPWPRQFQSKSRDT